MKTYRLNVSVEAEQYKKGLEDGFIIRYHSKEDPTTTWGIKTETENIPVEVPFINTVDGTKLLEGDEYIIYFSDHGKDIVTKEDFENQWVEI